MIAQLAMKGIINTFINIEDKMASIKESVVWQEEIYQIERSDAVSGGENGIANKPIIGLANRTKFLKFNMDAMGKLLSRCLVFRPDNLNYQANNKRIENLAEPVEDSDAATKIYIDGIDANLQNQIYDLQKNTSWGWELLGKFSEENQITKRNHIIHDERNSKYYNWIGELPHFSIANTNPEDEIKAGKPWIVVDNTSALVGEVEEAKRLANQSIEAINNAHLPSNLIGEAGKLLAVNETENGYQFLSSTLNFIGFKKAGARLVMETGDDEHTATDYDDWDVIGRGAYFTISDDGNLILNI